MQLRDVTCDLNTHVNNYHEDKVNENRPSTIQVVEAIKGRKNLGVVSGISFLHYDYRDIREISEYLDHGLIKGLKFYPGYEPFYPNDSSLPYIYTKSLWLPIAMHFSWNFFQGTVFGYNVSGHITYSLIAQTRLADNIWNGGKFGFEGSVLSVVFQIIAILFLWWFYHRAKTASEHPEPVRSKK